MHTFLSRVSQALANLKAGKMIILTDHVSRENEGDLICAAEHITPELMGFMIRYSSGIICLSLPPEKLQTLNLPLMVSPEQNNSRHGTPFTLSIEAKENVTTGVSAHDRTTTILTAIHPQATAQDIVSPGHIFPLQAKTGGVLVRSGHTEGALDLVQLADLQKAAVLCEVMNDDGSMARGGQLEKFAKSHDLMILSIQELIDYRRYHEDLIAREVSAQLPLKNHGLFTLTIFEEKYTQTEQVVLTKPSVTEDLLPLVRLHSSCLTGDLFHSEKCDCAQQLDYSLKKISQAGGKLIYLNQEGRGIGLFNKIQAYALQDQGFDTVEANHQLNLPIDARQYYFAALILKKANLLHIRLLTNNPAKIVALKKYGILTVQQEPIPTFYNPHNQKYLQTKKEKLHHLI